MTPGYKTTEFWLNLLAVCIASALAAGALGDAPLVLKIAGAVLAALNALGYGYQRMKAKDLDATLKANLEMQARALDSGLPTALPPEGID